MGIPANSGIKSGMMQTDTIQITSELLALISEVDEFKGAWRWRFNHRYDNIYSTLLTQTRYFPR